MIIVGPAARPWRFPAVVLIVIFIVGPAAARRVAIVVAVRTAAAVLIGTAAAAGTAFILIRMAARLVGLAAAPMPVRQGPSKPARRVPPTPERRRRASGRRFCGQVPNRLSRSPY
jgi:hypothetical protein